MRLLLLSLLLCLPAHALEPVPWPNPGVAWANTTWAGDHDDHGQRNLRPGRWNRVPIPGPATHALLKGILIVTHAGTAPVCELVVWWRVPGVVGTAGAYVSQTISVVPGGGVRTPDSVLVPVRDGVAEMWWDGNPAGQTYPHGCAFGFTYRLQAVIR